MSVADKPIALYVHWPWCVRKCPYCDFNSHAIGAGVDEAGYIQALLQDVDAAVKLAGRRPVSSVFFGGGTPSLMSVQGFETLMTGLRKRLLFAEDAEITLEANPGTHEAARFAGYVANGVNRFSIGVQSFDDERLKALGRIHNRRQVGCGYAFLHASAERCDDYRPACRYHGDRYGTAWRRRWRTETACFC